MTRNALSRFLVSSLCILTACTGNAGAAKKHVVFVAGDHEYGGELTLPIVAQELEKNYGIKTTMLYSMPDHNGEKDIPGLDALKTADLAVFYLRWRQLPEDQCKFIMDYLQTGKAVMGFRTTSHSFKYPAGHALEKWNAFGEFALGTPPGWGGAAGHTHYGHKSSTDVSMAPGAERNPILKGVDKTFHSRSWLYKVVPMYPPKDATQLLMGKAVEPNKPAEDSPVAWTWKNQWGGRAFYTSLGHPDDFRLESFQRLVINAIHWALGQPVPDKLAGKMTFNVEYGQHRVQTKK